MKELDLVLGAWLADVWPRASAAERMQFEHFLELPDPVIAAYLLGREIPADAATLALVDQLRISRAG